jgi:hypothetical protein
VSQQITEHLDAAVLEFRTNQSLLGRYSGLNPSRISRGMTGELPFTAEESRAIEETIAAMRQLQASIPQGIPADWSQYARIKPLIDAVRKQLQDESDPMLSRYCVVRVGLNFFDRVNSGEVLTRPDQLSCACFESPGLANQVVRELLKIGCKADVQIVPLMRRRSETIQALSQIGFTANEVGDAD